MNNHATSPYATGIKFGILAGLIYMIMLYLRYAFFSSNPMILGTTAVLSFIVYVLLMIAAILSRRKELGGYADIKQLFQTVFIMILIAELCFAIFNFIYLKYIDPQYMDRMVQDMTQWMQDKGVSDDIIEQQMSKIEEQKVLTFGKVLLGFGSNIVISSIVGLLLCLIFKRKNPNTDFQDLDTYSSKI